MGIDVYYYSKNAPFSETDYLWTIDEEELPHVRHIFEEFERRTGYHLDEYGDLKLSPGALANLLEVIVENSNKGSDKPRERSHRKLREVVEGAIERQRSLAFIGD